MAVFTEPETLVDIRSISVDKSLSKEERMDEFIRQIKNPYRFKCGAFIVNASFAAEQVTIEERLQSIIK